MLGQNFVKLGGFLVYPELKYTAKGYPLFKAKLAIPVTYERNGEIMHTKSYVKVCAWGAVAEGMACLAADTPLVVTGSINETSYEGKCKQCGSAEKKYWTDVTVDSFMISEDV